VQTLGRHLQQTATVIRAALIASHGDGIQIPDPLVKSLKEEALVRKYGLQVVVYDLVDIILLQGTS